ncbi:MAG TPA: SMI1/KNR4 family protein [Pyrinomonadaceae bacterium]|jgi:hypothetical protein
MWENCREKLERLKNLDRQCQAFGAEEHRYIVNSRLPDELISDFEEHRYFKIPLELRRFYMEVGNGIAGPGYGLSDIFQLGGFRPHMPYEDVENLKQRDGVDFDISRLTGVIPIVPEGCGHQVCLIASGEKAGKIIYVSEDGYAQETSKNFAEYYTDWLDGELEKFELVEKMMRAGASYSEISDELQEKSDSLDAGDMIASIADAAKPAELFGTRYHKIYHGAVQFPWYEKILREWQEHNL